MYFFSANGRKGLKGRSWLGPQRGLNIVETEQQRPHVGGLRATIMRKNITYESMAIYKRLNPLQRINRYIGSAWGAQRNQLFTRT